MKNVKRYFCLVIVAALTLISFHGCSFSDSIFGESYTIDSWKLWVLSKVYVKDYTVEDVVSRFVDDRNNVVSYKGFDYIENKSIQWWRDNEDGKGQDGYSDKELLWNFRTNYAKLAELTLVDALNQVGYKLKEITSSKLKDSMIKVIGNPRNYSSYKTKLKNENSYGWDPDYVVNLSLKYQDEFFENVMVVLDDFTELQQLINETVQVHSCERNFQLSSEYSANVFDVIYSIQDKMYVKCTILESDGRSEIQIVNRSTHLLSL